MARRFDRKNLSRRGSRAAGILLSFALVAPLAACGDDDDVTVPGGDAEIRVLHLSPTAPEVDVFLNGGQPAVTDLAFQEGTGYVEVPAGDYRIDVAAANRPQSEAVLTVPALELEGGKSYTAVAYDNLASIKALALVDDLSAPGAGMIRVRAIHAAPGVGQVDIWNVPVGGAASPLYENVNFGVTGAYKNLPAGSYRLGFDVNNDGIPDLTFTTPSLAAGTVANLFAVNDAGGTVFLVAQLNDGTVARIDAN